MKLQELMFRLIFIISFFLFPYFSFSQGSSSRVWVDSVMKTMDEDQRIAQLFMVSTYSNKSKSHISEIKNLIEKYHIWV